MTPSGIITLTTDFGAKDAFVGVMKGVMLGINPSVRFVDLSNNISPQDLLQGAFVIGGAWRWFPEGTVHLVVVDPGVGSGRAIIASECDGHLFIAPDNGILTTVWDEAESVSVVEMTNADYFLPDTSRTFHGRDIFAPASAHLSNGVKLSNLGPAMAHPIRLPIPRPTLDVDAIRGKLIYIDGFGNAMSNITESMSRKILRDAPCGVTIDDGRLMFNGLSESYAEAGEGEPLVLFNSFGLLECAIRNGNAADVLGLHVGQGVVMFR